MNANCVFVRTENWRVRAKPEQSVRVGGNGLLRWNKRQRPDFLSDSMKVKRVDQSVHFSIQTSRVLQITNIGRVGLYRFLINYPITRTDYLSFIEDGPESDPP